MKKALLTLFSLAVVIASIKAQCTTTNGTSCQCANGASDCDLLPDIILADEPLRVLGGDGVIEYSQTGNGTENGRLRVSVSTPNIGHGPLTVRSSSIFICGSDTFTTNPGTCPGGGSPRQLCFQRVYHRNGATMTYYDRPAGSMTYHPTHLHMHVDDWGIYTLRERDTTQTDPLQWPIIGTGAKLGFCLMDYGTCSYYNGHCVDSLGNTLGNTDFPNFGLGGGNYNCSPIEQGISSGYADIYFQYLDGMYIDIPPGTCNKEYYIVVQIDPHNYFLEENENNNVIAVPYTLSKQVPVGVGNATIISSLPATNVCEGTAITLTANQGDSYYWSSTDTTQSITVTQPGNYSVSVTSHCGVATSNPVTVSTITSHINSVTPATGCEGIAELTAQATGTPHWFSTPTGGTDLYAGNNFAAPAGFDTFYVESHDTLFGLSGSLGPVDTAIGAGGYYSNDQHEIFTAYKPLVIKAVKVFTNSNKNRTIELRNSAGNIIQSRTLYIQKGVQVLNLGFHVTTGTDYQLGWATGSSPDWYRNSSGASYPYSISNLISVTGNSASDLSRWYAYYDWQVEEEPLGCASERVPVAADITPAPAVTLTGLNSSYSFTDGQVTLTGTPAGGTFGGTGVTGNTFSPSVAGIGGPYAVSYTYTDNSTGCPGTATVMVTVLDTASEIFAITGLSGFSISPNPNNGTFELSISSSINQKLDLHLTNVIGQKVFEEKGFMVNGVLKKQIRLTSVAKGVYQLTLTTGGKQQVSKLVVE
jgi:hypothetical protein